jgi:hypothetical protein
VVAAAKADPLPAPDTEGLELAEADRIEDASTAAAVDGFHLGIGVAGGLMIVGGVIAGIGLRNPRRPSKERQAPLAATAGECARCAEDGHDGRHAEHKRDEVPA